MLRIIRYGIALVIVASAVIQVVAQTNSVQLRSGAFSTTILPSSSSTISVQIPSLTSGTHYLLTSTTNPGSSGAAGSFISYGATSAQNSSLISATNYLFNVSYASDGVEQNALGGLITATATGTNTSATALTLSATGTGSGTSDALYISNGRLKFLESTGGTYFTTFKAGDQSANINYTLPTAAGTDGQALITNSDGELSWGAAGATNLDGLSDAKVQGDDFTGSMILGHQATGTPLSAAIYNTAVGIGAMDEITQGDYNTALGSSALTKVTTGSYNIAVGSDALVKVNTGSYNVSLGSSAGREITTGTYNVSVGHQAGNGITTGVDNIAIGYGAFYFTTTGSNNVGVGRYTMNAGPTGSYNVAVGSDALRFTTGADHNVAIGNEAGYAINTGDYNSLLGYRAGYSLKTGSSNVFIGYTAGSNTASDASDLLYIDNTNTNTPLIYGNFSGNTLTFNGAITTTGTSALNGNVTVGGGASASEVKFLEPSGGGVNYTAFKAQAQGSDITYTLPASIGSANQVLSLSNTDGTLSWATATSVGSIDDLSDAKSGGTGFDNSLILGHQTTGAIGAGNPAENNTAVGYRALQAITIGDDNTALGKDALYAVQDGYKLTAIGSGALQAAGSASRSVAVGYQAGYNVTSGEYSVFVGMDAGKTIQSNSGVVAVGYAALTGATGGTNVAVGAFSGAKITGGTGNVLLGYFAGPTSNVSNSLYIDNSETNTPLIYGDFSGNTLTFNGATTTTGNVTVQGTTIYTPTTSVTVAANSDGASATALGSFTGTYEKRTVTNTSGATAYVQLATGTDGQVAYVRFLFTGSNSTIVKNSTGTNLQIIYDGSTTTGDVIVTHLFYAGSTEGWVVLDAIYYQN